MPENAALTEARVKGLKFYFTGIPCRHGHIAPRRTLDRGCTACRARIEKKHYDNNRAKRIEKTRRWQRENPEVHAAYEAAYPKEKRVASSMKWKRAHRLQVNAYQRDYRKKNPSQFSAYYRKYYANDPQIRIKTILRSRLRQTVKRQAGVKANRAINMLGCTIAELKAHLECRFLPGMSWDNYGYGSDKWNIDHIRPCASFDLTDPAQQHACFHFTNLQPLWQPDNFNKGVSYA